MNVKVFIGSLLTFAGVAGFVVAAKTGQVAIFFLVFGLIALGGSAFLNVLADRAKAKLSLGLAQGMRLHAAGAPTRRIPLTLGFANLSGEDLNALVAEDAAAIAPLFHSARIVAPHQIPSAEILFVYVHLNEDGTLNGQGSSGIRQIVQLTKAVIVVVASPNSAKSIQSAVALPGPKTANLIFTMNRNGTGFGRFFRELFDKMRDGKPMLSAWVELAPQHPKSQPQHAPQTILLAEAGNVAFPAQTSNVG